MIVHRVQEPQLPSPSLLWFKARVHKMPVSANGRARTISPLPWGRVHILPHKTFGRSNTSNSSMLNVLLEMQFTFPVSLCCFRKLHNIGEGGSEKKAGVQGLLMETGKQGWSSPLLPSLPNCKTIQESGAS